MNTIDNKKFFEAADTPAQATQGNDVIIFALAHAHVLTCVLKLTYYDCLYLRKMLHDTSVEYTLFSVTTHIDGNEPYFNAQHTAGFSLVDEQCTNRCKKQNVSSCFVHPQGMVRMQSG